MRRDWLRLMKDGKLICALCGLPIYSNPTRDHWIPKSKGGESVGNNIKPAHKVCNGIKGDLIPEDWNREKLARYEYALAHFKLKYKQRRIVRQAIQKIRGQ